jgi:mycothiol synthase
MLKIRLGTPDDYASYITLIKLIRPESPLTVDYFFQQDAKRDPKCLAGYFVAEDEGEFLGYTNYEQNAELYHPQKFWMSVRVMPEHRRKGIGTALFDTLLSASQEHQAISLHTTLQEDNPAGLQFAKKRGFVITGTRYPSRLDPGSFDSAPYQELFAKLEEAGIRLHSVASLASDPERDAKLLAIQTLIERDVPLPVPLTELTLEQYRKAYIENPQLVVDASMVAVHQGRYVGLTMTFKEGTDSLLNAVTGVHPEYRGKGIATALKVRVAEYAKAHQFLQISTVNDEVNTAILRVNDKMGFVRQPAQYWLDLDLQK